MSEKKNFWAQEIGTQNAVQKFGALSPTGDVTASWSVTGVDGRHFIALDEDGKRTGWTTLNCPGAFQINAGEDIVNLSDKDNTTEGRKNKVEDDAIFINAENGDVVIRARNGKLRFEGLDIEFVATGNNPEGTFWVRANENIKMDAKNITVDGKLSVSVVSTGIVHMRASITQICSGLVNGVTAATIMSAMPKGIAGATALFSKLKLGGR